MRSLKLLAVIVGLSIVASAFAADWPHWRGPDRTGIAPDTGINKDWGARPPEKLWETALHDGGYAGPSVADGKVFIIDHEQNQDVVRAIDVSTGEDLWQYRYEDLAKADYGYSRSTPVYDAGRLYTVSYLGKVACIDANSGEIIWGVDMASRFNGRRPKWGYAMSVLVDGENVVIVPGGPQACVAVLNKLDGSLVWAGGGGDIPGYATPVKANIQGIDQYVVFTGKSLIGADLLTGTLLWRVPWETQHDVNAATPLVAGNHIFVTSNYRRGCALIAVEPDHASVLWESPGMSAHFNTPVFMNGYLFGPTNPNLVCLDPRTGEVMRAERGFERGGVVGVDGVILALSGNQGFMAMVEPTPQGYHELGRFTPLGGQSWAPPIVSDGRLIVRNADTLACFDLM